MKGALTRPGQRARLFERLINSETKAELLILFHTNPDLVVSLDELAERLGRLPGEIKKDVDEFVKIGLLNENPVYSFDRDRDREIQKRISRQLQDAPGEEEVVLEVPDRRRTGIALIDDLLPDGYATPLSILVLGDPGSGRTVFCQQFLRESIKDGQLCIYASLDDFPDSIRMSMGELGVDVRLYERMGRFIFVDCYSPEIGLESKERLCVDSYSLSDLSISLSKALAQQEQLGTAVFILDSLTTLVQKCGVQPSLDFLRTLIAKTRMFKSVCLIKLNRRAFHSAILAAAQDMVDCVIEMKAEERANGLSNYLRISKIKGHKHRSTWTPYLVLSDEGLVEKKEEV